MIPLQVYSCGQPGRCNGTVHTDLEERVRDTIAATFGIDVRDLPGQVNQSSMPEWSSMNHLMLLAALEEQFGTRFTMREMATATSLDAIVDVLERHGQRAKAS